MRLTRLLLVACCLVFLASGAQASDYQYMTPETLKTRIEAKSPVHVFDIQVADEYAEHHLPGAMKSCAYPVKSDEDKAKVEAFMDTLKADGAPIVIICPRGKGGAKRTYDYMKDNGISAFRLYILEDGQAGWPYDKMIRKGS